jgi:hypothetical protein
LRISEQTHEGRRRIFLFSTKATGQANVCRDKDPPTLRAEKAAEPRFLLPAHLLCLIICQKRWINNAAIQSSAGTYPSNILLTKHLFFIAAHISSFMGIFEYRISQRTLPNNGYAVSKSNAVLSPCF